MIRNRYNEDEATRLEASLKDLLKAPLSLTVTDNTSSLISVKREKSVYRVRLHHMFLSAGEGVLKSLAKYISGKSKNLDPALMAFIKDNAEEIRKAPRSNKPRRIRIITEGRCFNLKALYQRLNRVYFKGNVGCTITWGDRKKWQRRNSVRLGSYSPKTNIIRVNPVLDRPWVPRYVIDDVIHHEMLHSILGTKKHNGRTLYHHTTFKEMEKVYVHEEKAGVWIKRNLARLLNPR
ncbi:MAG: hypothetical protein ABII26_09475 [Pseudomonadota bacterium]